MNQDKVLSSLSLCKKAGLLACGEFQVEEAVNLAEIQSKISSALHLKVLLTHMMASLTFLQK